MLEKIIIFIVFLGPLVFFHELGHFLFARLAGVRVEVFSIGFGPKLLKWSWKGTQYTISAIPLGGYVKMFGDDPLSSESLSEEEKKVAFTHKSKWQRFWIVFGGPLANFVLAFFIYFSLVSFGEKVPEVRVGKVKSESKLFKLGLRTGDVLKETNDQKIQSFDDLNLIDSKVNKILVKRGDQLVSINTNVTGIDFLKSFSETKGQLRAPIFVDKKLNYYYLSPSQMRDSIDYNLSLEEIEELQPKNLYLFPVEGSALSVKNINEISLYDKSIKISLNYDDEINAQSIKAEKKLVKKTGPDFLEASDLALEKKIVASGYYPIDLVIENISKDSPAENAGIKKSDIIIAIDSQKLRNFQELKNTVQRSEREKSRVITVLRKSEKVNIEITPSYSENNSQDVYRLGVMSGSLFIPVKMVESAPSGLFDAIVKAFNRTKDGIVKTFIGYKKLFMMEVPLDSIGGPVAIGKVAADSFDIGASMFFRLMAIISLNLGIINLFPIPVLDGGHIMFLIFEFVNGGPLSRKKILIAQQFGMSLLFLLIFVALYNDVTKILL